MSAHEEATYLIADGIGETRVVATCIEDAMDEARSWVVERLEGGVYGAASKVTVNVTCDQADESATITYTIRQPLPEPLAVATEEAS